MWGVRKIPWRRETPPTPVFWPREFHGVYTPWGHKESDKIWWLINNTEASPFVRDNNSIYTTVCMFSGSYVSNSCSPVAPKILSLWNFSGKNTEMGCHFLLQGIFLTQELNPCLLHCRQILYPLGHRERLQLWWCDAIRWPQSSTPSLPLGPHFQESPLGQALHLQGCASKAFILGTA